MEQRQSRLAQPIRGNPVHKYFLDRTGIKLNRMGSRPGAGHFDIAKEYLGAEAQNLYHEMATRGFARVLETDEEIHVEARNLTRQQNKFLSDRSIETELPVVVNNQHFIESKDPRHVVARLLA